MIKFFYIIFTLLYVSFAYSESSVKAGKSLIWDSENQSYTANGDVDDYHVSGYIFKIDEATGEYETDENGDAIITMALNETSKTELNGRASVEIEEDGQYRFVFIVGTFDKSGGFEAGASMRIDNIVAEFPYSISEEAVSALLQSVNYSYDDAATI